MKFLTRANLLALATLILGGCATPTNTPADAASANRSPASEAPEQGKSVAATLQVDFERFMAWFPGEYDNHEQAWQDQIDLKEGLIEQVHEHIHHIFHQVSAPAIGDHIFFVKQYMDGDPSKVYRQRLYRFTRNEAEQAIELEIFVFKDEAAYADGHLGADIFHALSLEELRATPGCSVYWRFNGEHFDGTMKPEACSFVSQRSGKRIIISDTLKLTEDEIWISDKAVDENGEWVFGNRAGIHHKNRKVRYFTGWAGVKKAGQAAAADDNEWHFRSDIVIHNEGQIVPLTKEDGSPTGYSVQLARLTYQNGKLPILKLGLIDDATGKTLNYSWTNVGASRAGFNLRWVQAGLTAKKDNPSVGY